jgi:hypothetical protein
MATGRSKQRFFYAKKWFKKQLMLNPGHQYFAARIRGAVLSFSRTFQAGKYFKPNKEDFVFIVGAGRSGNTLVRRLLMERSDIFIPPESYVLPGAITNLLGAGALRWPEKVELFLAQFEYHPEFETFEIGTLRDFANQAKNWPAPQQNTGRLLVRFYFWIAESKGLHPAWVGDKTPLNTLSLGLLKKLLPRAKFVYLERDGVDVAASYVKAGIYNDIVDAAERWKQSKVAWRAFRGSLHQNSYHEIRYEDLVSDPVAVIDDLVGFLEIPTRKENLDDINEYLGDVGRRRHHENVLSPVDESSVGKGRLTISDADRQRIKHLIDTELLDSGYEAV